MKCPKCGWQNLPGDSKCLQCGAPLTRPKIPTYPLRAKRKSRHSITKIGQWKRVRHPPSEFDASDYLAWFNNRLRRFSRESMPKYLKVLGITVVSYIPGLVQFIQKRISIGFTYIITATGLIISLFMLHHTTILWISLILLCILAILSSCDAVIYYYKKRGYLLNFPVKIGIVITSISIFLFIGSLLLIIVL